MRPLELARQYMDCFFGASPLADMRDLLADELIFSGPLLQCSSADDYMTSLFSDPPRECRYTIVECFENAEAACLIYMFFKPGVEMLMSQTFRISGGKISRIDLIFDTGRRG